MLEMKLQQSVTEESKLPQGDKEMMSFTAYDGGEMVGYCLFKMEPDTVVLYDLLSQPKDFGIVDGLARAVISYADNQGKTFVRIVSGKEELDLFATTLGIFADNTAKIEEVFSGCSPYNADGTTGCDGCPIAGSCTGR